MMINYQKWRSVVRYLHIAVVFLIPFLQLNGESILRFDIPSLRLYFFSSTLMMDEFFIVALAFLFVSFLFITLTVAFGRIWCGWLCPQTVMSDLTEGFVKAKTFFYKLFYVTIILALSILASANMIWYFQSPYDFFADLINGKTSSIIWGFWTSLTLITFFNFTLLRQKFCATVCPYSKLQSVLFDDKSLIIAFDRERTAECVHCKACVRVCPVNIDIRKGLNPSCVSCARCVDRCNEIFTKKTGGKGLIQYFWGERKYSISRVFRMKVIIFGLVSLVLFVAVIISFIKRAEIDMVVLPNTQYGTKFHNHAVIKAYKLALQNRVAKDITATLKVLENGYTITPKTVTLPAGRHVNIPVFIQTEDIAYDDSVEITIMLTSENNSVQKKVIFNR